MKKTYILALLVMGAATCALGATGAKFTVTVLHEDKPVREFAEKGKRRAAIPFGSEYKLRLQSGHNRRAVAKVTIDGAPVSKLGDFVIPANGEVNLERFLDASLEEGKRFKFVRLDHEEVDDPTRKENGLVRVEFRLEKVVAEGAIPFYILPGDWTNKRFLGTNDLFYINNTIDCASTFTSCSYSGPSTEPGATVGGGKSTQRFREVDIETEEKSVVVELWVSGIKPKLVELGDFDYSADMDCDHSIALGYRAMLTPGASYEFVFGDPKLGYYRVQMTPEEYESLTALVRRAKRDNKPVKRK